MAGIVLIVQNYKDMEYINYERLTAKCPLCLFALMNYLYVATSDYTPLLQLSIWR